MIFSRDAGGYHKHSIHLWENTKSQSKYLWVDHIDTCRTRDSKSRRAQLILRGDLVIPLGYDRVFLLEYDGYE